jgi:hypothetical protein
VVVLFSLSNPEKEDFQTRVIRPGRDSKLDVRIIRVEIGGSKNSPLSIESCVKDSCSIGSGGRGRIKENEKYTRTNLVLR